MKNKNLLAENMLRFRAKNLSETAKRKIVKLAEIITEQKTSASNSNITLHLNDIMSGKSIAPIAGNNEFYAFPIKPGTGQGEGGASALPGDVATYNNDSAIYYNGGDQYIVVGNIGTLDKTGQSIQNEQPRAFKVIMKHSDVEGFGKPVQFKVAPFPVTNVATAIAKLLKASVPTGDQKTDVDLTDTSKKFIDNMVTTFKLVGMAGDISNMDTLYKSVRAYI